MKQQALIWVLTWSVLGPVPESGEQAKFATQADCEQARIQKREEYREKKLRVVTACYPSTK